MDTDCLIGVFRQVSKDLDNQLKARIKSDGLPIIVSHIPLFYTLPETGESMPFNEITRDMAVSKSSLSDILKRNEDHGLIYREENKDDKRVVNFGMTLDGIGIKKALISIEDDLLLELMKDLSEDEKNMLDTMIRKIAKK